jgi:hypothetical protein
MKPPDHYWRIRWEVVRDDGTVYRDYTPIHYTSYKKCKDDVDTFNAENHMHEFPVYHYAEEFTVHP